MEYRSTSLRSAAFKSNPVVKDIAESMGKLPPQAVDLEESVLGALMLEKNALTNVVDFLQPDHFYKEHHRDIYTAIKELFKSGEPVDMRTTVAQLRKQGKLELVGGAFYIAELTAKVSSAANIEYHARIIVEMAIKRQLIQIASTIHHDAYEDTTDVFQLLDKTEQTIFEISDSNLRKNYDEIKTLMVEAINEIDAKKHHVDGLTGVPSGFVELDRMMSGWQKSDLVIIGARPGMGKTAFVVSAMCNAAIRANYPVAIFSLEMASIQLVMRMIAAESELESEKIRKGSLKDYEWQQMVSRTEKLSNAPIYIDDTPALTILELRAKSRRLKAEKNIQLLIIDYLQLMQGDNHGNKEQEISSISRSLKALAKELNIPVIALSQLSRSVEMRGGDKRPQLSDLRESGSIEQDADIVMFLYRPEYYGMTDEAGASVEGLAEVIVAKHRNGSTGKVKLKFLNKFTKFADYDLLDDRGFNPSPAVPSNFKPLKSVVTKESKMNKLSQSNNDAPPPRDDGQPF